MLVDLYSNHTIAHLGHRQKSSKSTETNVTGAPGGDPASSSFTKERLRYVCTFKGYEKVFANKSALERHLDVHQGVRYLCEFCGNHFSTIFCARRHQRDHCQAAKG